MLGYEQRYRILVPRRFCPQLVPEALHNPGPGLADVAPFVAPLLRGNSVSKLRITLGLPLGLTLCGFTRISPEAPSIFFTKFRPHAGMCHAGARVPGAKRLMAHPAGCHPATHVPCHQAARPSMQPSRTAPSGISHFRSQHRCRSPSAAPLPVKRLGSEDTLMRGAPASCPHLGVAAYRYLTPSLGWQYPLRSARLLKSISINR